MDIVILTYPQSLTFAEIEGYLGCLTAPRKNGVLKKKTEKDRINALLSRLLMLSEISARTGIPQKKIAFDFGSHGKPYLKNSHLQFSLSHTSSNTGGAVCMAFSEFPEDPGNVEIGIDIESKNRKVNPIMYKRVLSEDESKNVHSDEKFIRCWVQKEAFLKRLGIGLSRDLRGLNTPELPDTSAFDEGEYIIGISGKNSLNCVIKNIDLGELLGRFTKIL